jgi:hypothetical protein
MGLEEMSTSELVEWIQQQVRKNRISNQTATAGINAIRASPEEQTQGSLGGMSKADSCSM